MSPSTLALLLILLGTLCSFIYISRPKQLKNGRKHPPGPRPLPVIGNLHLLGKLPHLNLHHLAKRYGHIMLLRLGYVPTIVVSSPQAAELFLKTHDVVFASRPKVQACEYLSYGGKGMGFTEYGSYWRTVRKWCTLHLLSGSKVEYFAPLRKAELGSMVETVKKAAAAGETVDISGKVGEVIEDIMYKMIFGRPSNSEDDNINLKLLIKEISRLAGAFNLSDFVPCLAPLDLQGLAQKQKRISKILDKFLEKIIDEHEQAVGSNPEEQKPHRNFVHVMVSLLNKPMNPHDEEQEYIIDRTNIKAIMLEMIAAGLESSAAAIEWALSELLKHPRVMFSLQQELETVVGRSRMVEESDLPQLTYLDVVVKESLRLHPVGPLLIPHESMEDITIDGYFIPKKSRIIVNAWSMGRDPDVWSNNAEEFFPERFIDSNIDLRGQDFQLIPFGSGRRGCPGMQLGLITIRLVLAQFVHCFDWELPDGMLPVQLDMSENFGLSMSRANPLLVKATYRLLDNRL
ncbi:Cytochrome P450 superfamily protein, putative isoform 2 [Theobroma cacao]|uniref:Cytochrome P450 superfamily protein, putative isoform 2 n=1 Tax=Theobroma cacao TaxID=3641 RepID=A0A061FVU2_THECC|nr:Cytochrome P450 superfamily protein, putative isoform 2 [Theobroma cacao]